MRKRTFALRLAHKNMDTARIKGMEARKKQLSPHRLLLELFALRYNIVLQKVVISLGSSTIGRMVSSIRLSLCKRLVRRPRLLQPVALHLSNKIGVAQLLGLALRAEVIEYRKQHCSYRKPQQRILSHIVQIDPSGSTVTNRAPQYSRLTIGILMAGSKTLLSGLRAQMTLGLSLKAFGHDIDLSGSRSRCWLRLLTVSNAFQHRATDLKTLTVKYLGNEGAPRGISCLERSKRALRDTSLLADQHR